jgi:2-hydroxy-3-keto-5-methylthiopentenyl-1-phosphate phosphatase
MNAGWIHDIGEKGNFYGQTFPTVLTEIISEKPSMTKVFDAIEYNHDDVVRLLLEDGRVDIKYVRKNYYE